MILPLYKTRTHFQFTIVTFQGVMRSIAHTHSVLWTNMKKVDFVHSPRNLISSGCSYSSAHTPCSLCISCPVIVSDSWEEVLGNSPGVNWRGGIWDTPYRPTRGLFLNFFFSRQAFANFLNHRMCTSHSHFKIALPVIIIFSSPFWGE